MTAQLANGGYKIYPKIVLDKNQDSLEEIKLKMKKKQKIMKMIENQDLIQEFSLMMIQINIQLYIETKKM